MDHGASLSLTTNFRFLNLRSALDMVNHQIVGRLSKSYVLVLWATKGGLGLFNRSIPQNMFVRAYCIGIARGPTALDYS